ncbi:lanthionine synthetase LanC family protein [Kitasatospora sp. DSM 101779]|uniref:class III lanthionine synthetase LanKC N-terminal domain-containing protein n=1 Tax=Kitasatospora sp. DSM 101779 TaxID=2853165 RepID=UPI0021DAF2D1|nr:lanthionine synthetase LanC family protein [Kitasatospora sp. DSM 101779]MCU7820314.1 protein kinase [Kitasatospora sp. DSM 101779]
MPADGPLQPWICALPPGPDLPRQGWKLHVSSYVSTASETLRRALPALATHGVAFKVMGSLRWLERLNLGAAGIAQVGKFITVYPQDEDSALEVAAALSAATGGLRGPRIPSDRCYADRSVVFYRYGGFDGTRMQTLLGDVVLAVVDPDGRLVPDLRGATPSVPDWADDPFRRNGLGASPVLARTVAGRYRPAMTLARSPAAVVQLALDLATPRGCILKRAAKRPVGQGSEAGDGTTALRREAAVLLRLSGRQVTPEVLDVVEDDDELTLVSEDLGGETLDRHVRELAGSGHSCSTARVVELGAAVADALSVLHEAGHVHGDLKSANIMLPADGPVRLIDLELAHPVGARDRPAEAGTRGYLSPACRAGDAVSPADDIYALGAVLYLLVTGAEPSRAPDPHDLLARRPGRLRPAVDGSLAKVVSRCLDPDPEQRFRSAREVRRALLTIGENPSSQPPAPAPAPAPPDAAGPDRTQTSDLLELARRSGDFLCARAESSEQGVTWRSTYYVGKGLVGRDINTGMAGTVLALAELAQELRVPRHVDILRAAARTLDAMPAVPGDRPRGLYVGDMGVVAALLRAGQVLSDEELVGYAVALAEAQPAADLDDSPDLFHGLAGRLRVHLMLWDETGDGRSLDRAVHCGDTLLRQREGGHGTAHWRIPPGYGDLSGKSLLGYAHGAAGVADALLDLYEATGTSRYEEAAREAAGWITGQAIPCLEDLSGIAWPITEGGRAHPPFWCHGATGIGRLLLHVRRLGLEPDPTVTLRRVCRSAALGARWSGPTLCHGLTGNAEFLWDAGLALDDGDLLAQARELIDILPAFAVDSPDGLAWISDAPRQITPDYLVGYAGIPVVLLRMARPRRRHQLSREGFRYEA